MRDERKSFDNWEASVNSRNEAIYSYKHGPFSVVMHFGANHAGILSAIEAALPPESPCPTCGRSGHRYA